MTSLFPSGMIDDLAREREVVVRKRKLDVRILVWTLIVGFAVDGQARSIAAYRCAYNGVTGQSLAASSFYDRFTEPLEPWWEQVRKGRANRLFLTVGDVELYLKTALQNLTPPEIYGFIC